MAALRILIRTDSPRARANFRELLSVNGAVIIVTDPALADVTLLDQTEIGEGDPALSGDSGPFLILLRGDAPPSLIARVTSNGASFVSDGVTREQLVSALGAVASGLLVREPAPTVRALRAESASIPEVDSLTAREHEILVFLGEGLGNRDIARALGLSDHTVKFHLRAIFIKLGVRSRTEAVSVAVRRGLLML